MLTRKAKLQTFEFLMNLIPNEITQQPIDQCDPWVQDVFGYLLMSAERDRSPSWTDQGPLEDFEIDDLDHDVVVEVKGEGDENGVSH